MVIRREYRGADAARARDALLELARRCTWVGHREWFGPELEDLVRVLHEASATVSDIGSIESNCGTMEVRHAWETPSGAGSAVGLSARRVRQLCEQQLVAHRRTGVRGYLVDVDDLQRYLRQRRSVA